MQATPPAFLPVSLLRLSSAWKAQALPAKEDGTLVDLRTSPTAVLLFRCQVSIPMYVGFTEQTEKRSGTVPPLSVSDGIFLA